MEGHLSAVLLKRGRVLAANTQPLAGGHQQELGQHRRGQTRFDSAASATVGTRHHLEFAPAPEPLASFTGAAAPLAGSLHLVVLLRHQVVLLLLFGRLGVAVVVDVEAAATQHFSLAHLQSGQHLVGVVAAVLQDQEQPHRGGLGLPDLVLWLGVPADRPQDRGGQRQPAGGLQREAGRGKVEANEETEAQHAGRKNVGVMFAPPPPFSPPSPKNDFS